MERSREKTEEAIRQYAEARGAQLNQLLGNGQDGIVWRSSNGFALKGFFRKRNYFRELECYERLEQFCITELSGFAVPQLIGSDPDLMVIEMGIVTPPYVLDFGKAHLDRMPDFDQESLDHDLETCRENYSPEDWERVMEVVSELRSMQIYYLDLRNGNIRTRADD